MSAFDDQIQSFKTSMGIVIDVASGDANTVVQTPAGPVPSLNKLMADGQAKINSLNTVAYKASDSSYAMGSNSLPIASIEYNIAIGNDTMPAVTGSSNISIGDAAGTSVTTGSYNTLVGDTAGGNIAGGGFNTAVGQSTLSGVEGGNNNTAIGNSAGQNLSAAFSYGTFIGAFTGPTGEAVFADSYATAIGAGAQVSTNNTVVLGRATDVTVIGATGDNGGGKRLQVTGGIETDSLVVNGVEIVRGSIYLQEVITGARSVASILNVAWGLKFNTLVSNDLAGASFDNINGTVTLPPGKYTVKASCMDLATSGASSQLSLYVTAGSLSHDVTGVTFPAPSADTMVYIPLEGSFDVEETATLYLRLDTRTGTAPDFANGTSITATNMVIERIG